jgi:hypothetical protein
LFVATKSVIIALETFSTWQMKAHHWSPFIAGLYDGAIKLGVHEEPTCNLHLVVEPLF